MKLKDAANLFIISLLLSPAFSAFIKDDFSYHQHDEGCSSTNADTIYVHLIPHSHDDVGWLKTVDEYYIGSNNFI